MPSVRLATPDKPMRARKPPFSGDEYDSCREKPVAAAADDILRRSSPRPATASLDRIGSESDPGDPGGGGEAMTGRLLTGWLCPAILGNAGVGVGHPGSGSRVLSRHGRRRARPEKSNQ